MEAARHLRAGRAAGRGGAGALDHALAQDRPGPGGRVRRGGLRPPDGRASVSRSPQRPALRAGGTHDAGPAHTRRDRAGGLDTGALRRGGCRRPRLVPLARPGTAAGAGTPLAGAGARRADGARLRRADAGGDGNPPRAGARDELAHLAHRAGRRAAGRTLAQPLPRRARRRAAERAALDRGACAWRSRCWSSSCSCSLSSCARTREEFKRTVAVLVDESGSMDAAGHAAQRDGAAAAGRGVRRPAHPPRTPPGGGRCRRGRRPQAGRRAGRLAPDAGAAWSRTCSAST